ncbi:Cgl0159 family (beta/alpha)8-fold protein [Nocardiopsis suaedae]|uniref:Aldolase n=1 Tax=Nocardiopsis suaedae TaxID=3018444 RepID=A0ABT4TNQ9_9ACTN|nr:aldolase [Nocardiopsis suaedae]MDA2806266.1 aldolase [Nocardiopsis suaedae]
MRADTLRELTATRVERPGAIAEAAAARTRPASPLGEHGKAMIIAADHPARGALRSGDRPMAMADRADLLDRLCAALARPGVTGVLGTADILEDLLLLGALEGKTAIGSMNRGGLTGAAWEIDDRFTGYDAAGLRSMRFEGGKMLLRLHYGDPRTADTMEACAHAVDELNTAGLTAMVEPFISHTVDGAVRNDLSPDAVARSVAIGSGLGRTTAHTWLKLPVVEEMERVVAGSTLPVVLLGGELSADPDAAYARWAEALKLPTVKGLTVGRSLLYPADDDVVGAVDTAVGLL